MPNIHTPADSILVKHSFILAITAAGVNGTVIDTLGYEKALAIFDSAPSGGGTTSDCKLQEGDLANGSDQADVATATFAQVTTAGGQKIETMNINISKRKRYLRLVHTGAGGAAAGQAVGVILLFNPRNAAPVQDVTPKTV
jgi:hypothetical protein